MEHTIGELHQMQSLSLNSKIQMTRDRIKGWIKEYGEENVAVAFSGGKDSTVLLDIVRKDFPDVEAMFVDTGLEYPEIREFVRTFENVTWLKPRMSFRQVIEKYGYPFISKEVAETVAGAKKYLTRLAEKNENLTAKQKKKPYYKYRYDRIMGQGKYAKNPILDSADQEALKNMTGGGYDRKYRKVRGIGEFAKPRLQNQKRASVSDSKTSRDADKGQQDKGKCP